VGKETTTWENRSTRRRENRSTSRRHETTTKTQIIDDDRGGWVGAFIQSNNQSINLIDQSDRSSLIDSSVTEIGEIDG